MTDQDVATAEARYTAAARAIWNAYEEAIQEATTTRDAALRDALAVYDAALSCKDETSAVIEIARRPA